MGLRTGEPGLRPRVRGPVAVLGVQLAAPGTALCAVPRPLFTPRDPSLEMCPWNTQRGALKWRMEPRHRGAGGGGRGGSLVGVRAPIGPVRINPPAEASCHQRPPLPRPRLAQWACGLMSRLSGSQRVRAGARQVYLAGRGAWRAKRRSPLGPAGSLQTTVCPQGSATLSEGAGSPTSCWEAPQRKPEASTPLPEKSHPLFKPWSLGQGSVIPPQTHTSLDSPGQVVGDGASLTGKGHKALRAWCPRAGNFNPQAILAKSGASLLLTGLAGGSGPHSLPGRTQGDSGGYVGNRHSARHLL